LHVAAHGVPMVVVYRGNPVLWHAVGRWVIKARTYSLVNILSGEEKHIAPEFIPWYGSDAGVAECVIGYLKRPAKMEEQRGRLEKVVGKLNQKGASRRVAEMAERMIATRERTVQDKEALGVASIARP
jgi:lipid-A-disaccharide synthase